MVAVELVIYPGKPKALNGIVANGSRPEACSVKTKTISTECQKEGKVVALACDEWIGRLWI